MLSSNATAKRGIIFIVTEWYLNNSKSNDVSYNHGDIIKTSSEFLLVKYCIIFVQVTNLG